MHQINECPVCGEKQFTKTFSCKDFTVSHETFQLIKCNACKLIATSPRPTNDSLPKYYLSEDYISHSNRVTSIIDLIYKISRHFTLRWKSNLIKKNSSVSEPTTLLDYGCGTGDFLNKMKTAGWSVAGVEPSAIARTKAQQEYSLKVSEKLTQVKEIYDTLTLWHVLEHVPDLNETLAQLTQRLSKNGTMFIAVPNYKCSDAKHYGENWAGYDVPRHLWHFSQENMSKLLQRHDLTLTKIIPMKLDAFYVSLLSEKYTNGKISIVGLVRAFINGLKSNYRAKETREYSSLIYIAQK
ncbi:MAG: class I SAM-dependent methyltransferase [Bacteroidota bacterium]